MRQKLARIGVWTMWLPLVGLRLSGETNFVTTAAFPESLTRVSSGFGFEFVLQWPLGGALGEGGL